MTEQRWKKLNFEFHGFPDYILDENWDCRPLDNTLESGAWGLKLDAMKSWSPTFFALELGNSVFKVLNPFGIMIKTREFELMNSV